LQVPRPPIIVGGTAKPRTVRAAIEYADEYNLLFPSVEDARDRKRVLDEAAHAASREPLRVSITLGCLVGYDQYSVARRMRSRRKPPYLSGTIDQVVERLRAYEQVGIQRAILQHVVHEDLEMVTVLGQVAEQLR
jgi:alkanesulfonate monooxygenase SsuD/methylene tetrahydromethanopterin reductase-like flavin-dependent oxidoreductase (luciferase family)